MNQTVSEKRTLNNEKQIKILALVALICTSIHCLDYFINYSFISYNYFYFGFPNFYSFISLIFEIAPCVLLTLYVFKYRSKVKAPVLVPVLFAVIAVSNIFDSINLIYIYSGNIVKSILAICCLLAAIFFILSTLYALQILHNRKFIVVASAAGFLSQFLWLYDSIIRWRYFMPVTGINILFWTMAVVGGCALYCAILIFGLKNDMPAVRFSSAKFSGAKAKEMTPEMALTVLKDKLELGIITEEEYKAQRAQIIEKL